MSTRTQRACDPCSVRKVQCDGGQPCGRCLNNNFHCTFLKSRGKPGPKGPRKRTAEAIGTLQSGISQRRLSVEGTSPEGWISPEASNTAASFPFQNGHVQNGSPDLSSEWIQSYEDSISLDPRMLSHDPRIRISYIAHQLNKYESRAYSIWPIFDTEEIIRQILENPSDMEAYGLATALCATFVTQFTASSTVTPTLDAFSISPIQFEAESRRARAVYDYRERKTIASLLTSFFLHIHAANTGRKSSTTLLLNEAVTMAHLMGLHKRSYYDNLDEERQQYCLRIYWILFISERAHSFQQEIPTTLHRADPPLPALRPHPSNPRSSTTTTTPPLSTNFIHLCTLFSDLDAAVRAPPTRAAIAAAQAQLNTSFRAALLATPNGNDSGNNNRDEDEANEVQRADIFLTQQWMRVFLWQYSLGLTELFFADGGGRQGGGGGGGGVRGGGEEEMMGGDGEDARGEDRAEEFSLAFPAQVARTALEIVSGLSRESLEAHGPGMETKLFEITNSLADVMICIPSFIDGKHAGLGPRDVVRELWKLLASFRGGNPAVIAILRDKLVSSGLIDVEVESSVEYQGVEDDN